MAWASEWSGSRLKASDGLAQKNTPQTAGSLEPHFFEEPLALLKRLHLKRRDPEDFAFLESPRWGFNPLLGVSSKVVIAIECLQQSPAQYFLQRPLIPLTSFYCLFARHVFFFVGVQRLWRASHGIARKGMYIGGTLPCLRFRQHRGHYFLCKSFCFVNSPAQLDRPSRVSSTRLRFDTFAGLPWEISSKCLPAVPHVTHCFARSSGATS